MHSMHIKIYGSTGWFTYVDANGTSNKYHILGATRNSNPDLKWESTSMFNVGLDFGFFNNRLTVLLNIMTNVQAI